MENVDEKEKASTPPPPHGGSGEDEDAGQPGDKSGKGSPPPPPPTTATNNDDGEEPEKEINENHQDDEDTTTEDAADDNNDNNAASEEDNETPQELSRRSGFAPSPSQRQSDVRRQSDQSRPGAFAVYPNLNTTVPASHHRHDANQPSVVIADAEQEGRSSGITSIEAYAVSDDDHDAEAIVRQMIDEADVVEAQPVDQSPPAKDAVAERRRRRIMSVCLVLLLVAVVTIAATVASAKSRGPVVPTGSASPPSLLEFCGEDSKCWASTFPPLQRPNVESDADDEFGEEVVLSQDGSILVVSANQCTVQRDDEGGVTCSSEIVAEGEKAGAVWVYDLTDGVNVIGEFAGIAKDELRGDISGNGQVVALSARRRIVNGTVNTGLAWFYYRTPSGEWAPMGTPISGKYAYDMAGKDTSLSYDGKTAAVAVPSHHKAIDGELNGKVSVYQFNGTDWAQLGSDIVGENSRDQFGWSTYLSKDGSVLVVGARKNDGNGTGVNAGHVRVYRYTGNDWVQMGSDIDGLGEENSFGGKLGLSDDGLTLVAGA